jgi:hypothetical protein
MDARLPSRYHTCGFRLAEGAGKLNCKRAKTNQVHSLIESIRWITRANTLFRLPESQPSFAVVASAIFFGEIHLKTSAHQVAFNRKACNNDYSHPPAQTFRNACEACLVQAKLSMLSSARINPSQTRSPGFHAMPDSTISTHCACIHPCAASFGCACDPLPRY